MKIKKCEWCDGIKTCVNMIGLDQDLSKQKIYQDKLMMICPQCISDVHEEETDPETIRNRFHVIK
jgi:hypothetical protein